MARVYPGIAADSLPPTSAPEFPARLRDMLTTLDIWARDASHAMGNITRGYSPVAGGTIVLGSPPIDLSTYFYLPGRGGGQIAYGGTASTDQLHLVNNTAGVLGGPYPTTLRLLYANNTGTDLYRMVLECYNNLPINDTRGIWPSFAVVTNTSGLKPAIAIGTIGNSNNKIDMAIGNGDAIIAAADGGGAVADFTFNTYSGAGYSPAEVTHYGGSFALTGLLNDAHRPIFAIRPYGNVIGDVGPAFAEFQVGTNPANGTSYVVHRVDNKGQFLLNLNGKLATTSVPLTISGSSSQSGDLTDWKNSGGTVLASISASGGLVVPTIKMTTSPTNGYVLTSDASGNGTWQAASGFNPASNYTLTGTWTFTLGTIMNDITSTTGNLFLTDPGSGFTSQIVPPGMTVGSATFILPDTAGGGGTFVISANAANIVANIASRLTSSTASSGCNFMDTTNNSKKLRFVLSGAAAANNNIVVSHSASTSTLRAYTLGEQGGRIVTAGNGTASGTLLGAISLTGQTATLADTTLVTGSTGSAGLYRVSVYMVVTTADVGAATLTANVKWNDGNAQTNSTITLANLLTVGGLASGSVLCYAAASQNVTVGVTLTKTNAPAYSVYARVEALG